MLGKDEKKQFSFTSIYTKGQQRRKHPRIPVEIKGSFVYMDAENKFTEQCLITSLSTGGLGFETNAVLVKNDIITVFFPLEGKIIKEDAKITRVMGKEVGCKFIEPNLENVKIIQDYIHQKIFVRKKIYNKNTDNETT